ncbi:hypothetical protein RF11_15011 [Thelohanellus kitauei]|uniref:Uncharacterized protein n=1 Tax=Thelohanellus kitauei TaxID=669202 RepID=A0A0C2J3W6_THEKT|nr:hypothetical protein RF11_15011 [Thelohanellus kitauei]
MAVPKWLSWILFLVFEVLAIGACAFHLYALFVPCVFNVCYGSGLFAKCRCVKVFTHDIPFTSGEIKDKTVLFIVLQSLFVGSAILAIVATVLAFLGFVMDKIKNWSVFVIWLAASASLSLSILYTIQYRMTKDHGIFIFKKFSFTDYFIDLNQFELPKLLTLSWTTFPVFLLLGVVVMTKKR